MFNIPGTRGPYFRHRIQYQWAKYRLQKRLVARVMQALKEKHTPKHQEEEKNVQKHSRRVRFNLTPKAVDFVNINPPTTTINRIPSLVNNLSDEQLSSECYRLNILYNSLDKEDAKKRVVHEWTNFMRDQLTDEDIDVDSIPDDEIEQVYNLWKAMTRSTFITQSGCQLIPQLMTVDELKSNLDKRHIIYKNEQREYLIRDLENTLLSEAKGLDSPYCDYRKRHITGTDLFAHQFSFCNGIQLKNEIEKRQLKCPKTLAAKKKVLIEALNNELSEQFNNCFKETLRECLRYRKAYKEQENETKSSLLLDLYHYKKEHNESIILELD